MSRRTVQPRPMTTATPARRGSVLIVAMIIIFAIAGMVLAMGQSARTELQISANEVAALGSAAVERGAEQYVLSILAQDKDNLSSYSEDQLARVALGTGYFWIVRPDYGDEGMPLYGLVDESSKINVNTADLNTLRRVPNMTDAIAGSIIGWRDADDNATAGGAESADYQAGAEPYRGKNAQFETVEELLLVRDVTRELLYGRPNDADLVTRNGWFNYFTVWSKSTNTTNNGSGNASTIAGRINVNTAPREVLMTLPNLTEAEVDLMIAERTSAGSSTSTDWVTTALPNKANALRNRITGQGLVYSADIVSAAGNGRAFKHVRIVVDVSGTAPRVVYRRDLTDNGWPLDKSVLLALRQGAGLGNAAGDAVR